MMVNLMTKKDYELIAEVLREYVWFSDNNPVDGLPRDREHTTSDIVKMIVNDLSDVFASENERFDNNKFLEACTL